MPYYCMRGKIPHKRHTAFRKDDGGIYYEHLMGNLGFTGLQSLLYTLRLPTAILGAERVRELKWESDPDTTLRMRHFRTHRLSPPGPSPITDRVPLLFNAHIALSLAMPTGDESFYRSAQGDEVVYVTEGGGVLDSQFGSIRFRKGDYLVIPRGITHRYRLDVGEKQIFFIVESAGHVRTPSRYRNEHGQLLEHSPYCERDIRAPENLETHDEMGEFPILIKKQNTLHRIVLDHHPFDVVGWDGCYYPWALNIEDFEPITGRVHQPPPVHQTLEGDRWVLCSFVPRLFDYHPDSIPVPYNHSNVMSDEMLYYCNAEFMSRKGIEYGSISLHPDGLPHGPQPGKTEESIGKKETKELAVMIDTFDPLLIARAALACEDPGYGRSWVAS